MTFAVARCGSCREPWAADLRHATAHCPRCRQKADLRSQPLLWQGETAQEAQAAVASIRGAGSPDIARLSERPAHALPRHDSPTDAAAARGAGIRNKSDRAEAVALALTRLSGAAAHDDLVAALEKSGLDRERSEAEVTRMLAADRMMEPKAGYYRFIEAE